MQIGVRAWDNQNLSMDVFAIDRVMAIKAMLVQQTRIPVNQQILLFASSVMQDDFTLQDYNVRNGEIVLQMKSTELLASEGGQLGQCAQQQSLQPQLPPVQSELDSLQLVFPSGLRVCRVCRSMVLQHQLSLQRICSNCAAAAVVAPEATAVSAVAPGYAAIGSSSFWDSSVFNVSSLHLLAKGLVLQRQLLTQILRLPTVMDSAVR